MRIHRSLFLFALSVTVARLSASPMPVTLQLDWVANVQYAGPLVAKAKGFYEQAGLDVIIRPIGRDQDPIEQTLHTPGLAIGCAESTSLLSAFSRGAKIKVLATNFQDSPLGWISLQKTGIKNLADLQGKRIGVRPGGYQILNLVYSNSKVKNPEFQIVTDATDISTLVDGKVDAQQGYFVDEYIRANQLSGGNASILLAKDYGYVAYSEVFFAPARWVSEEPEAIRRFLAATKRGWEYALANRDEAIDVVMKIDPTLDREYQRASFDAVAQLVAPKGKAPLESMSSSKWKDSQRMLVEYGLLDKRAKLSHLLDFSLNPGRFRSPLRNFHWPIWVSM